MRRRRDIVLEQPGQPILRLWKDGEYVRVKLMTSAPKATALTS